MAESGLIGRGSELGNQLTGYTSILGKWLSDNKFTDAAKFALSTFPTLVGRGHGTGGGDSPFDVWKNKLAEDVWGKTNQLMKKYHSGADYDAGGLRDVLRHFILTDRIGLAGAMTHETVLSGGERSDYRNNLEANRLKKKLKPILDNMSDEDASEYFVNYAAKMLGEEHANPGTTELKDVVFPSIEYGEDPTIWDYYKDYVEPTVDSLAATGKDLGSKIADLIHPPPITTPSPTSYVPPPDARPTNFESAKDKNAREAKESAKKAKDESRRNVRESHRGGGARTVVTKPVETKPITTAPIVTQPISVAPSIPNWGGRTTRGPSRPKARSYTPSRRSPH